MLIWCFINDDDAGQAGKPSIGIEFGPCGDLGLMFPCQPVMLSKEFDQAGTGISEAL
ncbi:hypothetical protein [Sphingomonas sp. HMP6]|uniref:hypothetical protein n=1 Tax=Sphingomonas sp. HMP6 TaxID=1517551 RepID=UPI0015966E1F|nr:hypothetical protein [Sphingomonas sp. HMP6]BCA58418.1 hypothetical protein HMP06_1187 [Sphingomonas sp. HMP6]